MKRGIFTIFLTTSIGLFLFSIRGKAEAENWKRFFNDGKGIWYYDKDSLHYPYNTKGFLGAIKTDKSIVRVWIKVENWWIILEELRCSQREIEKIQWNELGDHSYKDDKGNTITPVPQYDPLKINTRIIPGSWEERLYNQVCK